MWVPRMELRLPGLVAGTLTTEPSHQFKAVFKESNYTMPILQEMSNWFGIKDRTNNSLLWFA